MERYFGPGWGNGTPRPGDPEQILPEGVDLPEWADEVKPIRRLRKTPLVIHWMFSILLFICGVTLTVVSVMGLAKQAGAVEASSLGTTPLNSLQYAGARSFAAAIGVIIVVFSWLSCVATEQGFCGRIARVVFAIVEFVLIISLFILGSRVLHEASSSGQAVEPLKQGWANGVQTAKESQAAAQQQCQVQDLIDCIGWDNMQCTDCTGIMGNTTCASSDATQYCFICPGQGGSLNTLQGCSVIFTGLIDSWYRPTGIVGLVAAVLLIFDFLSVIFLFPCFEVRDGVYVMVRKREHLRGWPDPNMLEREGQSYMARTTSRV
mmetsp:Transcript_15422/g.31244  ORF Transcript_15422/g.31244 Transcript_15422/m.31244 type:complete len:320 (-) Transcript_15422:446-1405(-)|eukprot:CAMPEP_0184689882 /NCGR_PEP_ID=MMETSP0312-20130426/30905_1 /TAXON_ID=31354 /ORGANISM="Compsopogon coeruleus, Strain SAG 36.94" /LENGTH=319 /DNA_ID=CAMNT_0027147287 /DNA_START=634 /DNA_END=1593 /DNA_ORIENTATION=+